MNRYGNLGAKMTISPNQFLARFIPAIVFAIALAMLPASINAQGMNKIEWLSDVEQAKKIASEQNKLVLLHFDAAWCRPCKALETYVFKSSAVIKSIGENVVPVKLDADTELNLVNEYDVSMVPFDVIITPGGRVVTERRSPADAENYAKMISGTSSASRMLEKEKMGPIAHQHKFVKNGSIRGQDPLEFRSEGPEVVEVGLSKDGSLLQRRQAAFTDNNSETKSNPFVRQSAHNDGMIAQAGNTVSVADLERDQFLRREREWVAPSPQTRRAKPQRIVNDRYFEEVAGTQVSGSGSARKVNNRAYKSNSTDFDLNLGSNASLSMPTEFSKPSNHGDFKGGLELNSVVEVSPESDSLLGVTPKVDRDTLCLNGKCPVTLITEGRWAEGDARYGIVHRNRTYIFESADKLATFRQNPDLYSPVLAGFDPVVYHEQGKLIEGLVENGIFMGRTPEQKVVLFKDAESRSKFQASPKEYMQTIRQATQNAGKTTVTR